MTPVEQSLGLDDHIVDAFAVLSLLIAVVAAYLAAVWPIVASLLHTSRPDAEDDAEDLAKRCNAYKWVARALAVAAVLVGAIMLPLVVAVIRAIDPDQDFSTLRASVLLFFGFLVVAVGSGLVLGSRLRRHAQVLREPA